MLSNFKISTKIYAFAALLVSLIAILGGVSLFQMQKIGNELVDIAEEYIPISNQLTQITINQLEQAVIFEKALATALETKLSIPNVKPLGELVSKFEKLAHKTEALIIKTEEKIAEGIELSHSQEAKQEFANLLATMKKIDAEHIEYDKGAMAVLNGVDSLPIEQSIALAAPIIKLEEKIDHELTQALKHIQEFTLRATLQAEHDEIVGQRIITIIFIISLVLALVLSVFIVRMIVKPVNEMRDNLQALVGEDADLKVQLPETKDEVGEAAVAFNQLMQKLRKMIMHISESTVELNSKSSSAIEVMDQALRSIEQQQQQTSNVTAAISQVAGSVREVSSSTDRAAELGTQVKEQVSSGLSAAQSSHQIIQNLSANVKSAATEIKSLEDETDRIAEVLNGIRGIAEQTNLLALNAAIEAARAGESGRGFAVVADEVRALAQRTQTSTQDIQTLLESLQQEVSRAVNTMQEGQSNAVLCLDKSVLTAEVLSAATEAVNEIAQLNTQIASAAVEQSQAVGEVHDNLVGIVEGSESTTLNAQETAATSHQISNGLQGLTKFVGQLKT